MDRRLLEDLSSKVERLKLVATRLQSEQLDHQETSALTQECADLAAQASTQLEQLSRDTGNH